MTTKTKTEEKKQKGVVVKFPNKTKAILMPDGVLYGLGKSFGAKMMGPMTCEEVAFNLTGKTEIVKYSPTLFTPPSVECRVPEDTLREWASVLLQFDTEALAIYGQHREDPTKWLAVVPEQEVTTGMADVDSFDLAIQTLLSKGYRRIGTIHTHPGEMSGHSGTDENELFDRVGGVHYIITRSGTVSFFYSNKQITFPLKEFTEWKHQKLWKKKAKTKKETPTLIGENGETDITELVKKKVYTTHTFSSYSGAGRKDFYDDSAYSGLHKRNLGIGYVYNIHLQRAQYVGEDYMGSVFYDKQTDWTVVDYGYGEWFPAWFDEKLVAWRAGPVPLVRKKDNPRVRSGVEVDVPEDTKAEKKWCDMTDKEQQEVIDRAKKKKAKKDIEKNIKLGSGLTQLADRYSLLVTNGVSRERFDKAEKYINGLEACLKGLVLHAGNDLLDKQIVGLDPVYKYFLTELILILPSLEQHIQGKNKKEREEVFKKYLKGDKK